MPSWHSLLLWIMSLECHMPGVVGIIKAIGTPAGRTLVLLITLSALVCRAQPDRPGQALFTSPSTGTKKNILNKAHFFRDPFVKLPAEKRDYPI
jgi:hypothetical protein